MAKRRMFNIDVVSTDDFHSMPRDAQLLYFNLGMSADDDGFVASPKIIMKVLGIRQSNLITLAEKGYIKLFDSGVCLITDWLAHNYIRRDRYTPTRCKKEKESLDSMPDDGQPNDIPADIPPVDTGKDRIGKVSSGEDRSGEDRSEKEREKADKPPRARFSPPGVEEVGEYCRERKNGIDPQRFVDFYTANGWLQGKGKPIKDWRAAVRTWEGREKNDRHHHDHGYDDTPIPGGLYL